MNDQKKCANLCSGCISPYKNCENVGVPEQIPADEDIPKLWKIDAPCRDNSPWAIALAYILQNNDQKEIIRKKLPESFAKVEEKVSNYNPFIDRHSCFKTKKTCEFIQDFKKLLLINSKSIREGVVSECDLTGTLLTAYKLNDFQFQCLKRDRTGKWHASQSFVKGYPCLIETEGSAQLSIAVDETLGSTLQQAALNKIFLECNELDNTFPDEIDFYPTNKNLTILLLKKGLTEIVQSLYKLPPYIFFKLRNAGFNTDMTKEQDEDKKYVFYYAVLTNNFELLLILYHYAANYPKWWRLNDRNIRTDDERNTDLQNVLEETKKQLLEENKEQQNQPGYIGVIDQLMWINEYRLDLVNQFKKSDSRGVYEFSGKSELINVIQTIIKIYEKYFYGLNPNSNVTYSKYKSRYEYFKYIDNFTGSMFFDYSYSLKTAFKEKESVIEQMESAFCEFLHFCYNDMNTELKSEIFTHEEQEYFTFRKRIDFKKELEILIQSLSTSNETVTQTPPSFIQKKKLYVLRSILQGHSLMRKLLHYINVLENCNSKSLEIRNSVFKRVLQVLGEIVKPCHRTSTTVIKSLIITSFPSDEIKKLREIREKLSHYDKQQRLPPEVYLADDKYFLRIKQLFLDVENTLEHIERVDLFLIRMHVLSNIIGLSHKAGLAEEPTEKVIREEMVGKAEKQLENFESEFRESFRRSIYLYEAHFKSLYDQIEEHCHMIETKKEEEEEDKEVKESYIAQMDHRLEHFRCLYEFIEQILPNEETPIDTAESINVYEENFKIQDNTPSGKISSEALKILGKMKKKQEKLFNQLGFQAKPPVPGNVSVSQFVNESFISITQDDENHISKEKNKLESKCPEKNKNCIQLLETTLRSHTLSSEGYKELCETYKDDVCTKEILKKFVVEEPLEFLSNRLRSFTKEIDSKFPQYEEEKHRFLVKLLTDVKHASNDIEEVSNDNKDFSNDVKQAAMELLFFECTNMLKQMIKDPSESKELWTKTDRFFHGVDLRNMLAHGNTLYDLVSTFAGQTYDLMCEITEKVNKMMLDLPGVKELKKLKQIKEEGTLTELVQYIAADKGPPKIRKLKYAADYVNLL